MVVCIALEERVLQDIVNEVLAQGVLWTTRARRLRGPGLVETRPSIRLKIPCKIRFVVTAPYSRGAPRRRPQAPVIDPVCVCQFVSVPPNASGA